MSALPARTTAVTGAALLAAAVVLDQRLSVTGHPLPALAVVAAMFVVYGFAAAAVHRIAPVVAVRIAVGGGAALQLVGLRTPPFSTNDYLRYAWDGRVQASGTDPYRYPPGASQLAGLRDAWLFPDGVTPRLNHPTVRTIYPPVAQAWFWLVHVLTGGAGQGRGLQVGGALLAVTTSVAIVVVLRRVGSDPRRVVWWAWCPTVVLEAGANAHVDVLASLLVVLALGLLVARRWTGAGALLGLAVATKLLPALVAVGVPPRRSLRVGLAAVAAVAVVYLPHVLVLGTDVTGFLGGYLEQEGHDRYDLLRFLLPDVLAAPAGLLVLASTALLCWRRAGEDERAGSAPRPWAHAAVMVGVTFVVLTPPYPWYALLLVPLVALGASRVWLVVAVAPYLVYQAVPLGHAYYGTRVVGYGLAAVVVGVALVRAAAARRVLAGVG